MSDKMFTDPHGIITFHDTVTEHRSGFAVFNRYLDHTGKTTNDISYQHFMVMLKHGTLPVRDLRAVCRAMTDCNLDPESPMMALYADCVPQFEPLNGSIEDEFCTVAENMGGVATQIKSGVKLADVARQDVVALNGLIANMAAAIRHMSRELISGIRGNDRKEVAA
ncbi:MAG: hypothetical protein KDB65_13445 [Calditrichaeota bacterium]|nr:hypothetical protein [Calditrichota bacterium]